MESIQRHQSYNTKLFITMYLLQVFSSFPCRGRPLASRHGDLPYCVEDVTIGIISTVAVSSPRQLSAAVDDAISDGVDAVLITGGSLPDLDFRRDEVAKAAFRATQAGILAVCPAGDLGRYGLANGAPWILTVGASTTDRAVRVSLRLGDGEEIPGESLTPPAHFPSSSPLLPLVHLATCNRMSAYGVDVAEKAVLCEYDPALLPSQQGRNVSRASAVIVSDRRWQGAALSLHRRSGPPTVVVSRRDARRLAAYASSSPSPTIAVTPVEVISLERPHPSVWEFSSRGPSAVNNGVLKPDIVWPGVDILLTAGAETGDDDGFAPSQGTSLAAARLAGIAALIRASRPDWSPAMIKSAIITSSDVGGPSGNWVTDEETGAPASVFAMGAGEVNPERAGDPGLVYDARPQDYLPYLCGLGYTDEEVSRVASVPGASCDAAGEIDGEELNYPSISVAMESRGARTVRRRVTNVGPAGMVYASRVELSPEVSAVVYPHSLHQEQEGEVVGFSVTFAAGKLARGHYQGHLWWENLPGGGSHGKRYTVRSPLSITVR